MAHVSAQLASNACVRAAEVSVPNTAAAAAAAPLLLLQVARGSTVELPHLSLLEVCGEPLLFMVNGVAVQRAVARSSALLM
jgi:hypothetical protein